MANAQQPKNKKRFPIISVLVGAALLAVLLTAGGFAFAANQESHDPFCASCHSQPESTFFQRSTSAQPVDLASYHTTQKTLCINCHSGPGITGRLTAELIGARNALKWYTGTAIQPAVVTFPIGDQNCLKCHQNITQRGFTPIETMTAPGVGGGGRGGEGRGGNGHWHQLLARWQAASSTAGTCLSCHPAHATDGNVQNGFLNDQEVQNTCDACHQILRNEGGG
jgi:nitrate/TMAO reductase-like tetraheme cytochrome c subunit